MVRVAMKVLDTSDVRTVLPSEVLGVKALPLSGGTRPSGHPCSPSSLLIANFSASAATVLGSS
jgi:hypothetical protein